MPDSLSSQEKRCERKLVATVKGHDRSTCTNPGSGRRKFVKRRARRLARVLNRVIAQNEEASLYTPHDRPGTRDRHGRPVNHRGELIPVSENLLMWDRPANRWLVYCWHWCEWTGTTHVECWGPATADTVAAHNGHGRYNPTDEVSGRGPLRPFSDE